MDGRKPKTIPAVVMCPSCGKKKLETSMPRTTHDGRICKECGKAFLTCHYCVKVVCDWLQGPPNSELKYMPQSCPVCGILLKCLP